jgi:hypothetical protein
MFITEDLSPAALLAELLSLRTRSSDQTVKFQNLRHNRDLCPRFAEQIDAMLDVYKRHRTDVHDIQGVRDSGVDVLLQFKTEDELSHKVGIQLKSFKELEDASRKKLGGASLLQVLKSQYVEATSNLGVSYAEAMAKAAKKTSRGRSQDRRRVAGGQDYEVRYEVKKTGRSKSAVKKAVKKGRN